MADLLPVQVRQPGDSLPRVDTRIVTAIAVDEDGRRHTVRALAGQSLFRALVNAGLRLHLSHQLDTSCYGYVCRVSISDEWRARIPEPTEDELHVLKHHFTPPDFDPSIRCSCKIKLSDKINGIVVALVPEKCWDFT
ncbi:hypothetical protein SELMODRAFT_89261 [Selaginella moellendorffii]|uniref:2Fe-2S ferredoxin-type domain-containing protein n=2 Tax=Selaginella moellendorffii TaxID=88036 RepID=D8RBK4_SELML|nr:hypothetical protein SELMODRAFT_104354 [Selaginella moellendorffii]EFJ30812.1 hypothetical protein SELMODRAFT_89261 [Selaginella moellendorffii]